MVTTRYRIDWASASHDGYDAVCAAAGEPPPNWRNNRATMNGWWRKGNNPSAISIHREKGFHDFVTGDGGGVLRFVEVALGLSRREALEWLGQRFGTSVNVTPEEARRLAIARESEKQRRQQAEWWRAAFIRQLENAKAEIGESLDAAPDAEQDADMRFRRWWDFGFVAHELFRIEQLKGPALVAAFTRAMTEHPEQTAALVAAGHADEEFAVHLTALIIAVMDRKEVSRVA